MYARTFRNGTSDMRTRAKLTEIRQCATNGKFEWGEPGLDWGDILRTLSLGVHRHFGGK